MCQSTLSSQPPYETPHQGHSDPRCQISVRLHLSSLLGPSEGFNKPSFKHFLYLPFRISHLLFPSHFSSWSITVSFTCFSICPWPLNVGGPQGSALGPFLSPWTCISQEVSCSLMSLKHLDADNFQIHISSSNPSPELQTHGAHYPLAISIWMSNMHLKISTHLPPNLLLP